MSPNVTGRTCNTKPLYNTWRVLRTFLRSSAAYFSHPSALPNSNTPRSESNQEAPKRRGKMPHLLAKTQISAPYSGERPWCQTPEAQEVVGVRAGFDRIYRINRIEGDGRNAEGAKKGIP